MAQRSQPNLAAERVICPLNNPKSLVWKYFGLWSVDDKTPEPQPSSCVSGFGLLSHGHEAQKQMLERLELMCFF